MGGRSGLRTPGVHRGLSHDEVRFRPLRYRPELSRGRRRPRVLLAAPAWGHHAAQMPVSQFPVSQFPVSQFPVSQFPGGATHVIWHPPGAAAPLPRGLQTDISGRTGQIQFRPVFVLPASAATAHSHEPISTMEGHRPWGAPAERGGTERSADQTHNIRADTFELTHSS